MNVLNIYITVELLSMMEISSDDVYESRISNLKDFSICQGSFSIQAFLISDFVFP